MLFRKKYLVCLILLLAIILCSFSSLNSLSASTWTVDFADEGMPNNNDKIQGIIDVNASSGDTILFKGSSYGHLSLKINKSLNIVSNVNTRLSACPSNPQPIFIIDSGGRGTNITGFNISSNPTNNIAIFINGSEKVKIESCFIKSGGNGLTITNSNSITIKNTKITNSQNAIELISTNNTKIIENTLTNNQNGIVFNESTVNNEITKNNISNNQGFGIGFLGTDIVDHKNVKITYNYINDNQDKSGVYINSSFSNMNISSNILVNNGQHGIFFDLGANKTDKSIIIDYNYIMNNRGYSNFEVQRINTSDEDRLVLNMGYNFFGVSTRGLVSLCAKTSTGIIVTQITKISNGLYKLSYLRQNERTVVKEMISHYVKVYFNNEYLWIYVNQGEGIIDLRESTYKTSGNEVYTYYKYKEGININTAEIPKKTITITITTDKKIVKNGENLIYTITVKNTGDKKVNSIQLSNLIPNLNINSFSQTKGSFNKNSKIWTISSMDYNEQAILKISLKTNKANIYKTKAILTGDGLNLNSNEVSFKVEDFVKISTTNKIKNKKIKKNKSTYLSSNIKNSGSISSKTIKIKITIPKGLKVISTNYKTKFNKKTNSWKVKVPSKKTIPLKMKVKATKKAKFKIIFNVNGKKEVKYLKAI